MKKTFLVLFFLVIFLTTILTVFAMPNNNGGGNNGLPDRIRMVEKVLEVEQLTKQPEANLLGTDYLIGDYGKLQAYLKIGEFPLETAICYVSVLYPDMTYFIEDELMYKVNKPYFEGLYYYDFIVDNVTGVYPVNAYCFYDADVNNDFITSYDGEDFIYVNSLLNTQEKDLSTFNLKDEPLCATNNCSWNATIDLPIGWNNDLLSDVRILLSAEEKKQFDTFWWVYYPYENIYVEWFNMTVNNIVYDEQFIINTSLVNNTHIVIGFDVFGSKKNVYKIDLLRIDRIYNGSYVSDLRGNNEIVVSEGLRNITVSINQLGNSKIQIVNNEQLGQFLLIVAFLVLLFSGLVTASAVIGLAYSFIYLDGLLTVGGAVICVMMIYFNKKNK